jgi:hypothetical protein
MAGAGTTLLLGDDLIRSQREKGEMHNLEHILFLLAVATPDAETRSEREFIARCLREAAGRSGGFESRPHLEPGPGEPLDDNEALGPLNDQLSERYGHLLNRLLD